MRALAQAFLLLALMLTGAEAAQESGVEMGAHLRAAEELSSQASITYDAVRENGPKVEFGAQSRVGYDGRMVFSPYSSTSRMLYNPGSPIGPNKGIEDYGEQY